MLVETSICFQTLLFLTKFGFRNRPSNLEKLPVPRRFSVLRILFSILFQSIAVCKYLSTNRVTETENTRRVNAAPRPQFSKQTDNTKNRPQTENIAKKCQLQ